MKKYFLLISFLSLNFCTNLFKEKDTFSEQIPNIYQLKSSIKISIINDVVFFNSKKYSGYLFEIQENTNDTILKQGYLNGLQSGISKKWYPNNKLMELRIYKNGKKDGKQVAFWDNGLKKFEFFAKEDIYEGELKEWNNDGKLIHLGNYKNGQEEGVQKLWYDNGKIRANFFMLSGKRYGLLGTKNCVNVSDSIFSNN